MKNLAYLDVVVEPPANAIGGGAESGNTLASLISTFVGAMTIIAAIWFLFKIIMGGIAIINSDGDKQAVANARAQITNGLIGLVIVIAATFIIGLIGFILGVDNILNVQKFLGR